MRKQITAIILLAGTIVSFGQTSTEQYNTYSPYSIFGVGQKRFNGTSETQSMAGIGIAYTPIGATNAVNPASLTEIRQTVYTLGATFEAINYKEGRFQKGSSNDMYFDYLVLSVPLSAKSGVSFGVAPYSVTGYSIYSRDSTIVDGSYKETLDYYSGNGGLNMVYLAAGYQIVKNLSIGVNAAYLFGTIDRTSYNAVEDRLLQTKVTESNWVNGFKFKFGLNYSMALKEETRLYMGATYEMSAGMKNDRTYRVFTVSSYDDEYDPENPQNEEAKSTKNFDLPWTLGVGIGAGNLKKWYVGLEGEYTVEPDYVNVDFTRTEADYQSGIRIALGGNYTPQYNSINSYFKRVRYQAGVYYKRENYIVRNTDIYDQGLTLGAILPMTKVDSQTMSISNLNIFVNYGMMGKSGMGLVKEKYFKIGLSFSLNDRWFLKQRYF